MALLLSSNQGNATLTCSRTACNSTLLSLTACETNSPAGLYLSRTHFRKKIWPSPFTSDIFIWCDAGAASWGATMENQKLQAQGFFLVFSPLSCGMAHPAAHCEKCGDFFTVLNPSWTSLGTSPFRPSLTTPTWSELWARAVQTCA